jgi:hypothetical protein
MIHHRRTAKKRRVRIGIFTPSPINQTEKARFNDGIKASILLSIRCTLKENKRFPGV